MEIDPLLYASQVQGHRCSYSYAVLEAVLKGRKYPKAESKRNEGVASKSGKVLHFPRGC